MGHTNTHVAALVAVLLCLSPVALGAPSAAAAGAVDPGRTDEVTASHSFRGGYEGMVGLSGMSDNGRHVLFGGPVYFAQHDGTGSFSRDMLGGYTLIAGEPVGSSYWAGAAAMNGVGDLFAILSNSPTLDPSATGVTGSNLFIRSGAGVRLASRIAGTAAAANNIDGPVRMTPDGRYVLFQSRGPRVDSGPAAANGGVQIYRYDTQTDSVDAVTVAEDNIHLGDGDCSDASISDDGRYVAFVSNATNLVAPHATEATYDLYVRDLVAGSTTLVSHAAATPTDRIGGVSAPTISADGGTVVFVSARAAALTGESSADGTGQIVAWSRATDSVRLVSRATGGGGASRSSESPRVSGDGTTIAFLTSAEDVVAGVTDANRRAPSAPLGQIDTDAYAETNGVLRLLSHATGAPMRTGNQGVYQLILSRDGSRVAFSSEATDLVSGVTDPDPRADAYAVTTGSAEVRAVSLDGQSNAFLTGTSEASFMTPDGSQIAFLRTFPFGAGYRSLAYRRSLGSPLPPVPPAPADLGPAPDFSNPPSSNPPVSPPPARPPSGYWMVTAQGQVHPFGEVAGYGNGPAPAVDLEPTPSGRGYWIASETGIVRGFGDAPDLGSLRGGLAAGERVTSLSRTPSGRGYWLFSNRGRVQVFGDAASFGDALALPLAGPILDSIPTPTGRGYYMVASDGGVFAYGDARFIASMGGRHLNAPVQSLVPDPDGDGYWLVASDGGVFAFGAGFAGSMGGARLNRPITGMVPFGNGYLMVGEDGGIFNFSNKAFYGSLGANPPPSPVVSVASSG